MVCLVSIKRGTVKRGKREEVERREGVGLHFLSNLFNISIHRKVYLIKMGWEMDPPSCFLYQIHIQVIQIREDVSLISISLPFYSSKNTSDEKINVRQRMRISRIFFRLKNEKSFGTYLIEIYMN